MSFPLPSPSNDFGAIQHIYPTLAVQRDFTVNPDGSLATWINNNFALPSSGHLAVAKTALSGNAATIASLTSQLATQYDALPVGAKSTFKGPMIQTKVLLYQGDVSGAQELIASLPVPNSLTGAQASMLALFSL